MTDKKVQIPEDFKIEIEHRHSDYGDDAGGYSVLRINGAWVGRVEGREGRAQVDKLVGYLATLEAKVKSLEENNRDVACALASTVPFATISLLSRKVEEKRKSRTAKPSE